MNQDFSGKDAFVNSLVGEGTFFRGEISINGLLRIDGDFSGSIKTRGKVFIGRNGRAESAIHASSIVIGGIVKGSVVAAEKVVILSSAVVIGSIESPRLVVEEGVMLDGEVKVFGAPEREQAAPTPAESGNGKKRFFGGRFFVRAPGAGTAESAASDPNIAAWNG